MILPLFFIIALFSGCTSAPECEFGSTPLKSSGFERGLGVNIHFTDPRPGEMKMIADAGFRWVRMDFKWDVTEYERGSYDFSEYDRLMKALDESRLQALFILDYGNPLYDKGAPPRNAETRRAFTRWAVAAAKHFANRGVIWEIYNEPNNTMFWPPRPNVEEYINLALAVGRAFRAEVPNEKLIGPAVSEMDFTFLEACFKGGLLDYWWAVSVHPYRHSDPETAARDYCRLRKLIEVYRIGAANDRVIPIISGEWGYSAAWRGMSEQKQGTLLARELLTNIANDIPISIWYDWRDDGTDPEEAEHHFGLVKNTYRPGQTPVYEPKPAYRAIQTLSEFIKGHAFEQRIQVGREDDYVIAFGKAGDRRFAAWTTSNSPHRVDIPADQATFQVLRHTGETAGSVSQDQKVISVEISTDPVYIKRAN